MSPLAVVSEHRKSVRRWCSSSDLATQNLLRRPDPFCLLERLGSVKEENCTLPLVYSLRREIDPEDGVLYTAPTDYVYQAYDSTLSLSAGDLSSEAHAARMVMTDSSEDTRMIVLDPELRCCVTPSIPTILKKEMSTACEVHTE
jgi:hypothetical protein